MRQANIDKHWVTSSGYMNCVSASGKLLGGRPCEEVLEEFAALPENERKPGTVKVPDLDPSQQVIEAPPERGLVLRVHARFLARKEDGSLRHAEPKDFPLMRDKPNVMEGWQKFLEPNTEYMWITRDEWQAMIPDDPAKGGTIDVDPAIAMRMARFHLTPQRATTSEGGVRSEKSVSEARLALHVKEVSPQKITLHLEGFVHWGSEFDELLAITPNGPLPQGYATLLIGRIDYDRQTKTFTHFDIVAPGEVWGRWGDANGKSMYVERPGKKPFGFAFELATGNTPTDRIPPGGNGKYVTDRKYFSAD